MRQICKVSMLYAARAEPILLHKLIRFLTLREAVYCFTDLRMKTFQQWLVLYIINKQVFLQLRSLASSRTFVRGSYMCTQHRPRSVVWASIMCVTRSLAWRIPHLNAFNQTWHEEGRFTDQSLSFSFSSPLLQWKMVDKHQTGWWASRVEHRKIRPPLTSSCPDDLTSWAQTHFGESSALIELGTPTIQVPAN